MSSISVEMTGAEDREGPLKIAVCGFAGAGKTLLASTAPNPLFVFFRNQPRIKSIADRFIPHVKIINEDLEQVWDKLESLLWFLRRGEHGYETIVFDTADELYQSLKGGRRLVNGGAWEISDWGWLADIYREILGGFIDLPLHVIANYHLKTTIEDDSAIREIALQGASKDEAPGWFDVVGVLDSLEDEEGDLKRFLLTRREARYPFLKDHYAALPERLMLSSDFVGDFKGLLEIVQGRKVASSREVIEVIVAQEDVGIVVPDEIPTPDELKEKKNAPEEPEPESTVLDAVEQVKELLDAVDVEEPVNTREGMRPVNTQPDPELKQNLGDGVEQLMEKPELLKEEEEEEEVEEEPKDPLACVECGETEIARDLMDLSKQKFKKVLCREHFKEARRNINA